MSKLKKIKNGEYIGGDKYTVTPDAGGKSKIVFSPDSILTEPTPVGAEILNEMQLNEVYTLDTVRSVDGQKEIYTATLEGFTEFDNPDLNFNLKINSENTNSQTYLRLNNIDYLIECKIGNLKAGSIVYAKKINNTIKIIGNKNFGTNEGDILEGSKLAEILGIEYGGVLNNNNQKVAGKGYYDTANKKIYKCTTNTSINYADAGYFIEVSNNDLLGKLKNLSRLKPITVNKFLLPSNVTCSRYEFVYVKQDGLVLRGVLRMDTLRINGTLQNSKIFEIENTDKHEDFLYTWTDGTSCFEFTISHDLVTETTGVYIGRGNGNNSYAYLNNAVIRIPFVCFNY